LEQLQREDTLLEGPAMVTAGWTLPSLSLSLSLSLLCMVSLTSLATDA